jgi:predicted amidohydrolase YtcJ
VSVLPSRPRVRDAHTHLAAGAADLLDLDLREVDGSAALAAAIARTARRTAPKAWIRGWGWDGAGSPEDTGLGHPIFLARRDGHAAWVNPEGRALLGLAANEAIVGEATFDAVRSRLPSRSTAERVAALRPRLDELCRHGIGAVDDMVEAWAPEVYAILRDGGELPVAIGMWLPDGLEESEVDRLALAFPSDDSRVAVRGIKILLDGTLGARTAALTSPYADDPGTSGVLRFPESEIEDRVARWARRGFAVALHAIGDRAVTAALSALERVPRPRFGSHRIEHAQVVRRSDIPRFARAGVVASVQPGHWRDDRPFLARRLGQRPDIVSHPLASLARAGASLLFGSDWPVSTWDPEAVLTSATDHARGVEALDAAEAAAWYTSAPR